MRVSRLRAVAFGALLLAASPAASAAPARAPILYEAPAQNRPAGRLDADPFGAVLPSGRFLRPTGRSVVVGMNALGVALSPDGRYAIVSNDDEREAGARSLLDPGIAGGYSLTVVDTETMHVTSQYVDADAQFFIGVVALRDPQNTARTLVLAAGGGTNTVYALLLDDAGRLTLDPKRGQIALPGPIDPLFADEARAFPGAMTLSSDGRTAYVVNNLAGSVSAVDTRTRTLRSTKRAGFAPAAVALAGSTLLVCNEGLLRYGVLPKPILVPPFRTPPPDLQRASSLSFVPVAPSGDLGDGPGGLPSPPSRWIRRPTATGSWAARTRLRWR